VRAGGGFRPDIEGLRAIAIGLVLVYHAGVRFVPGGFVGVDVFFVISGFLITGLLVRELQQTGRVSLARFYARRAKRLLPATAVVLAFTALVVWLALPVTQRAVFGGDIAASALYVINWRLAARSVDYLAEGISASPVQHFWSLAVEEQFYIIWPLAIVAVAWWSRRRGVSLGKALLGALIAIATTSFVCSMVMTARSPELAFFVTPTRLWELAVGAAVALALSRGPQISKRLGTPLLISGLLTIAGCGVLIDASNSWPGHLALVPTLATAALILGGYAAPAGQLTRLLGSKPLVWIGGLSYSLYLWHWPVLVLGSALWGELGAKRGLLVVAVSFVPAWLSHRYVENPIRFSSRVSRSNTLALQLAAICTVVGVAAGAVVAAPSVLASRAAGASGNAAGARAITAANSAELWQVDQVGWLTPDPLAAVDDVPVIYEDGCQNAPDSIVLCEYGDPDGERVVALVGDSKAAQWQSALDIIAQRQGWRLITVLKSSCAFADGAMLRQEVLYRDCVTWNADAVRYLLELRPDVILTNQGGSKALRDPTDPSSDNDTKYMVDGLASRWHDLVDAGLDIVVIAGNPGPSFEVYECVAQRPTELSSCSFDAEQLVADVQRAAVARVPQVKVLDMNDLICPADKCPAVIGNVLLYRQGSHLTRTYIDSMTSPLEERLRGVQPDLFP